MAQTVAGVGWAISSVQVNEYSALKDSVLYSWAELSPGSFFLRLGGLWMVTFTVLAAPIAAASFNPGKVGCTQVLPPSSSLTKRETAPQHMLMGFTSRTAEMDSSIFLVLQPTQPNCVSVGIVSLCVHLYSHLGHFFISICPKYAGPTQVCAGSWDWNSALGVIGGSQDISGKCICIQKKKKKGKGSTTYLLLSSANLCYRTYYKVCVRIS